MYYHVTIKPKSDKWYGEYKTDLTREQVVSRYVEPYEQGLPILINGKTITPDDIERIKFYFSEKTIESYVPAIRAEEMNSSVTVIGGPSYTQTAISRSQDITDDFISGPPGYKKQLQELASSKKGHVLDKSKVFIVHGHDDAAQTKAARFVEKLGLEAIILHEKASSGRTIIEKIEHYSNVGFAIVLYTPDDIGNAKSKADELNGRARQNVVFEHGYLIGKLGRENVAALVEQPIELPNDISGVVYINIDEAAAWQLQLAKEMKQSGYNIDMNDLI
ncbi:nucleotide-binding protein [Vibrio parahaemolyticus]|nr:nucleotide-binding protein [Vibrio parahaemolyticus]EIV8632254.1 nucleotide-binding protein [Vibrio parahaemolyticus]EJG0980530.1 nucleotide-binding protein [Vibrio parahaemolyticus]EJG1024155.1 nucleotide-binding protein [Vibrio parahaemolyticus]ELA9448617.1 nucleotide-binding protein [Vibrio parahaemolyticus]